MPCALTLTTLEVRPNARDGPDLFKPFDTSAKRLPLSRLLRVATGTTCWITTAQLPTQHEELPVQPGNGYSHPSMSCNMSQLFARPRLVKLQTAHTQAAPTFATPTLLTFAPHPASCLPIGPYAAHVQHLVATPAMPAQPGHDKTLRSYFDEPN